MPKNFIIPLVVYPFDVMVSVSESDKVLGLKLSALGIEEDIYKWESDSAKGRCCLFATNQGLIRIRNKPETPEDYGYLQHEIFHYVVHLFSRIGLKWSHKSDEAYAYLIGYLTEEIYKRI